ncbi:hypothetical protein HZH68_007550 [Vespula germanica]|uniref:Uncharacterized protein n=1 Tax=Vespula germanica TaxID=30212 RepID=A0A834N9H6_VESGE|nr:hypothetical protein HZH68_007550 [Vespula germanica]
MPLLRSARNLKLMALPRVTSVVVDAKTRFRVDLHRALQNQSQLAFEGEEKRGVESEEASFMMEPEFIVGPPVKLQLDPLHVLLSCRQLCKILQKPTEPIGFFLS